MQKPDSEIVLVNYLVAKADSCIEHAFVTDLEEDRQFQKPFIFVDAVRQPDLLLFVAALVQACHHCASKIGVSSPQPFLPVLNRVSTTSSLRSIIFM